MRYVEPFFGGGAVFFRLKGTKSPLRWAGGKRRIADLILNRLFGDAAPVIDSYWLADTNPDLMAIYQAIQRDATGFGQFLEALVQTEEAFAQLRALEPQEPLLRAVRAAYLNLHCHSGLWRVNKAGRFNVPPQRERFKSVDLGVVARAAIELQVTLQGVQLDCKPFWEVLPYCGLGDYVYLDPPYLPDGTSQFVAYDQDAMDLPAHLRLADLATDAVRRGAQIVTSNSPAATSLYLERSVGLRCEMEELSVQRSIGVGKGESVDRKKAEVLITLRR